MQFMLQRHGTSSISDNLMVRDNASPDNETSKLRQLDPNLAPDANTPFDYILGRIRKGSLIEDNGAKTVEALDQLADAMVESAFGKPPNLAPPATVVPDDATPDSNIPPIYTYWAQFIDHELTARTDRDDPKDSVPDVDADNIGPVKPADLLAIVKNQRSPNFELDAIYGQPNEDDDFRMIDVLRSGALMRIGNNFRVSETPPDQSDIARDLPRLSLLRQGHPADDAMIDAVNESFGIDLSMTDGDIDALDISDSEKNNRKVRAKKLRSFALIGDHRNDENLLVAQFHLGVLRFHNAVVRFIEQCGAMPDDTTDSVFERARKTTQWTFQWLVVNDFLVRLCNQGVLQAVLDSPETLYEVRAKSRVGPGQPAEPFMPLEFSIGAYRFGHSMIRNAYDLNRNFGRDASGNTKPVDRVQNQGRATLDQLFQFTGNLGVRRSGGELAMEDFDVVGQLGAVPSNWIVEWDRFVAVAPGEDATETPARAARKIDTHLAPPLGRLLKEGGNADNSKTPDMVKILKNLAARNLRRSFIFSTPTGQAMAGLYGGRYGQAGVVALTETELKGGLMARSPVVSQALNRNSFASRTPLWTYILAEAEIIGQGNRLGPLGSAMIADTMIGILRNDPNSYLGKDGDPTWHPGMSIPDFGPTPNLAGDQSTIEHFLSFAGVLV
ncbi:MAG: hypothetical protein JXQ99_05670 [Hyphomicrobiaceae bacterium]